MNLSPLQERALAALRAWYDDPSAPQVFYLGGYAGAGKSTILRFFTEFVRGRICYCAFTGKAALVMRQKGCPTAQTIHSLIYAQAGEAPTREQLEERLRDAYAAHKAAELGRWKDAIATNIARLEEELASAKRSRRSGGPKFRLNAMSNAAGAALIVVDEASMCDERVGRDLESFGAKILAVGDPAQLPPVFGQGYFTSRDPDFLLDEVHRQSEDSAILWAATRVRSGEDLPGYGTHGDSGELVIARRGEVENERRAREASQIIVGRNATRRATNRRMRQLLGHTSPWPVPGDRLICLRNDHEAGLLNGSLWDVVACKPNEETLEMVLDVKDPDDGRRVECVAWMHHVAGREEELRGNFARRDCQEFDFGYAITCHKSQGSGWPSVYVLDESAAFGADARRHLYTSITRASERLVVVR